MTDVDDPNTELGAEVIQLRPRVPADQGLTVVRGSSHCGHRSMTLDSDLRAVTCRSCKGPLDAFDSLLYFARQWDRFREDRDHCQREIKASESRLDLLKRKENNARARAKRQFDDLPSKNEMDSLLDGHLYMWVRDGLLHVAFNRKALTAEQCRGVARALLKAARECEKAEAT